MPESRKPIRLCALVVLTIVCGCRSESPEPSVPLPAPKKKGQGPWVFDCVPVVREKGKLRELRISNSARTLVYLGRLPAEIETEAYSTFRVDPRDLKIREIRNKGGDITYKWSGGDDELELVARLEKTLGTPIKLPLSKVSILSWSTPHENSPAPVVATEKRYRGRIIEIEGMLQGPGVPAGLGTTATVGLHTPADPRTTFLIPMTGNAPRARLRRARLIGYLVKEGTHYKIDVQSWELLGPAPDQ